MTKIYWNKKPKFPSFCHTKKKDLLLFSQNDNLVFCNKIRGLLEKMALYEYFTDDWQLKALVIVQLYLLTAESEV